MEIDFYTQSSAFLYSIILGVGLGIVYGPCKALRLFFLKNKISIFIADLLFMIFSAFVLFFYCLAMIYGYVRFYILLGAFFGFFLYRKTLGFLFFRIYFPFFLVIKKLFDKIMKNFKISVKKLLKSACKILYNIKNKCRMFNCKNIFLFGNKKVIVENERSKKIPKDN